MSLSARTEYACLATLQLAQQYESGRPVCVASIAERHGIPAQFLVQILSRLKGAGLVRSTRGPAGGYRLSHPPQEMTLAEVIEAIEGTEPSAPSAPNSPLSAALLEVVAAGEEAMRQRLSAVTLAELAESATAMPAAMYYI